MDSNGHMIVVQGLAKYYSVHEKDPGLKGSLQSFFRRKTRMVKAVDGVSFTLDAAEMVGFLGPNGAGKTTTLKMLAGLLHPSGGEVRVGRFTPKDRRPDFLKQITLVMGQKQQLLWDLPALDSFLVNQAIYEVPDDEFKATMREFSEILDLEGILKKQVRKLSLGERMKCELAAALLHRPRVLFLDEPTIGLDVNMQVRIREFVAEYNRRYDATVLLTSHYMADVTALCRRIIVMDKGHIVFDGDLSRLVEQAAPSKIIRLELAEPVDRDRLQTYGRVHACEGLRAEILVDRRHTREAAARLLADLPVVDVTIEDPPIEEVIGLVFAGGEPQPRPAVDQPMEVAA
ncbi:MAG TPA: ATP-binding cassette domain-containing protein [Herpetosiphonaceae bacterium]|nr:ATP-binding cassette domain-containing protein [Herpetosiphonaceae bacterium]